MAKTPNRSDGPFVDSDAAPLIYFDAVAAHGVLNGAVQIELVSRTLVPLANGVVKSEFLVTGRLRCTRAGVEHLREVINKCLDMLAKKTGATDAAVGGSLN